jgi:hypothetical protein
MQFSSLRPSVNSIPNQKTSSTRRTPRLIIFGLIGVLLAAGIAYWWRHGGEEQLILFLQADFRVAQIDPQKATMTLTRPGETLVVSCAEACDFFRIGKKYSMMNRGGVLEFKSAKRKLELPILEQHLEFEKPPGGQG